MCWFSVRDIVLSVRFPQSHPLQNGARVRGRRVVMVLQRANIVHVPQVSLGQATRVSLGTPMQVRLPRQTTHAQEPPGASRKAWRRGRGRIRGGRISGATALVRATTTTTTASRAVTSSASFSTKPAPSSALFPGGVDSSSTSTSASTPARSSDDGTGADNEDDFVLTR